MLAVPLQFTLGNPLGVVVDGSNNNISAVTLFVSYDLYMLVLALRHSHRFGTRSKIVLFACTISSLIFESKLLGSVSLLRSSPRSSRLCSRCGRRPR